MIRTWHTGDVGNTPGFDGDTQAALRSIRCPLLAMPAEKDLYFPPEDEQWASQFIPDGDVRVIPGVWGHFAGGGAEPRGHRLHRRGHRGDARPPGPHRLSASVSGRHPRGVRRRTDA